MMSETGGGFFFFFFFFFLIFLNKNNKFFKKYKMIKYARENRGKIIKGINNNTVLEGQNCTPTFFLFFFFPFSSFLAPFLVLFVLK